MPYKKRQKAVGEDGLPLPHAPPRTSLGVELSVTLLVLGTPLAIGTVHLWTVLGMLALAGFGLGALLWRTRRRALPIRLFPLGLLLLVACGLTGLQIIPLPAGLVGALSPGAAEVFEQSLAGTPLEGGWRTFSLSAPSTALELLKLLGVALAFVTVVNYFTDRHRARRLLKAVAWSGFLVALIGFFTKLFMAQQILGFYPMPQETFFFSTFVNPNHLAGYLILCSPVALGLALSAHGRQDRALFGFMGVIMGVAVFMSLSRGGMIAYVAALCFLLFFAGTRQARRLKRTALIQMVAAAVLLVAGYLAYDAIHRELRTLGDFDALREETKIQAWSAVGPLVADHPVLGVGRGAYHSVSMRYKTLPAQRTFTHVENQSLQYLADWGPLFGGLFSAGLLGCFLLGLARAKQSYSMGGILAGLFGSLLSNLVDFNWETGAVLLLLMLLFAVLAASPFTHAGRPGPLETRWRLPRPAVWGLLGATGLVAALAVPWTARGDLGRATGALLAAQDQPGPVEPCDPSPLGQAACRAMDQHPADYLAPLLIGRAQMRAPKPDLKAAIRWLSAAMFLNPTEPTAHRLTGRALFLAGLRSQALVEYRLAAIYDPALQTATVTEVLRLSGDPQAAIQATPDEAVPLLATARILNTLNRPEAAAQAARLALERNGSLLPALDLLSDLALRAGRLDEAADLARQASEVDPLHEKSWVMRANVLIEQSKAKEAEELLREGWTQVPDSTQIAYRLVDLYLSQQRHKDAETAAVQMQSFVSSDDRSQARLVMLLGRIKEARQIFFEARQLYRQAVDLQPTNLPYLYHLGRMEERIGAWDEAERIFSQLRQARFSPREMDERIGLVRAARRIEQERAQYNRLLQPDKPSRED